MVAPHELAIEKLNRLGLSTWIIQWFQSCLSARKAFGKGAHFNDVNALKSLYYVLVRSGLEYGVQIWPPYPRIERDQKRFNIYALRWNDPVNLPPYEPQYALLNIQLLSSRRVMLQRLFVFDAIVCKIDCSSILKNVRLHEPVRQLQNSQVLWISGYRTLNGRNNLLDSCCRLFRVTFKLYVIYDSYNFISVCNFISF